VGRPLGAAGFFVSGGLGGSEDMLNENRLLMWTKREKACLIWISSTNTYKENTYYISFRFTECVARGVRKVTVLGRKGRFWAEEAEVRFFSESAGECPGRVWRLTKIFFRPKIAIPRKGRFGAESGFFFGVSTAKSAPAHTFAPHARLAVGWAK